MYNYHKCIVSRVKCNHGCRRWKCTSFPQIIVFFKYFFPETKINQELSQRNSPLKHKKQLKWRRKGNFCILSITDILIRFLKNIDILKIATDILIIFLYCLKIVMQQNIIAVMTSIGPYRPKWIDISWYFDPGYNMTWYATYFQVFVHHSLSGFHIEKLYLKGVKLYSGAHLLKFEPLNEKYLNVYGVSLSFTSVGFGSSCWIGHLIKKLW